MGVVQCFVVVACLQFHPAALKAANPEQEHSGSKAVLLTMVADMAKLRVLQELPVEEQIHWVVAVHMGLQREQERKGSVLIQPGAVKSHEEDPVAGPLVEVAE